MDNKLSMHLTEYINSMISWDVCDNLIYQFYINRKSLIFILKRIDTLTIKASIQSSPYNRFINKDYLGYPRSPQFDEIIETLRKCSTLPNDSYEYNQCYTSIYSLMEKLWKGRPPINEISYIEEGGYTYVIISNKNNTRILHVRNYGNREDVTSFPGGKYDKTDIKKTIDYYTCKFGNIDNLNIESYTYDKWKHKLLLYIYNGLRELEEETGIIINMDWFIDYYHNTSINDIDITNLSFNNVKKLFKKNIKIPIRLNNKYKMEEKDLYNFSEQIQNIKLDEQNDKQTRAKVNVHEQKYVFPGRRTYKLIDALNNMDSDIFFKDLIGFQDLKEDSDIIIVDFNILVSLKSKKIMVNLLFKLDDIDYDKINISENSASTFDVNTIYLNKYLKYINY
jgi:hypothetical protein